jgi:hypothetical protein
LPSNTLITLSLLHSVLTVAPAHNLPCVVGGVMKPFSRRWTHG